MLSKITYSLLVLFTLTSCFNKETAYVNHVVSPLLQQDKRLYPLSLLQVNNKIDVVLVVDNSGSMRPIQDSVINNAKLFFEQFAKEAYVDWKVGIISTDKTDDPYLGFKTSFDSTLVDQDDATSFDKVVVQFQNAMSQLGISGAGYEYTFYNLKRLLDRYSGGTTDSFQRGDSHLVVIMISDEKEQSMTFGNSYEAINFLNTMKTYVSSSKKLRFYGAIKHKQLKDCTNYDNEPWKGSEFEKIITASEGFVVSACVPKFGNELARIGKDIASLVGLPSLLLRRRPVVSTLEVYYKDIPLAAGPEEEGGAWFYEEVSNTINFYNLDFVTDLKNGQFRIEFEVDDGVNRDY